MSLPTSLLHIEDQANIRLLVSKVLTAGGVQVSSCTTIAEAERLGGMHDVALIDNHLPDGLGVDFGTRLRERFPHMTLLLCTAAPHGRLPRGIFDGYLGKPFHLHQLFVAISDAMEKRQREHERQAIQDRLTELRKRIAL